MIVFRSGGSKLDYHKHKEVLKKALTIAELREWVSYWLEKYKLSVRQACRTLNLHCSVYRCQPRPRDDEDLRKELQQLAGRKPRWASRKCISISEIKVTSGITNVSGPFSEP